MRETTNWLGVALKSDKKQITEGSVNKIFSMSELSDREANTPVHDEMEGKRQS